MEWFKTWGVKDLLELPGDADAIKHVTIQDRLLEALKVKWFWCENGKMYQMTPHYTYESLVLEEP